MAFVKAAYADFLNQQPTTTELTNTARALTAGTLSRTTFLTTMANSDEWLSAIVTKMYADTLGRAPDAAGLAAWVTASTSPSYGRDKVAYGFYQSTESRMHRVLDLYQALLKRNPTPPAGPTGPHKSSPPATSPSPSTSPPARSTGSALKPGSEQRLRPQPSRQG